MKQVLQILIACALVFSQLGITQGLALQADDSRALDCYRRALAAVQLQRAQFADIQACDAAVSWGGLLREDLVATYVNRGLVYAVMGKLDRAERDYSQALTLAEDVPEIFLNRGNMHLRAGQWKQAIDDYTRAEQLGLPQLHVLHFNRGMAYAQSGRLAEAETDYQAALEIAPEWSDAREKLRELRSMSAASESGSPQGQPGN